MNTARYFLLALAALLAVGCQSSTPSTASTTGSTTPSATTGSTGATPQAASTAQVPDDLKTDAYHYYGFDNAKPVKYRVTTTGRAPIEGTQTTKLDKVEGGKAIFKISRDGGLAGSEGLGDETLSVEKDGIFTISASRFKGDLHNMELPAKLTPGVTWKNESNLTTDTGMGMKTNQTYKVERVEPITTEVGKQEGLLVTSSGTAEFGGAPYRMQSKNWYVKDKGMVKSVTTLQPKSGDAQTITIEEVP